MNTFSEKQRFTQWWLWAILAGTFVIPLIICLYDIKVNKATYSTPEILSGAALPLAVLVFIASLRLHTQVDEQGVWYRFFPFHPKLKLIPWSDIQKAYIRQYKPIMEYGGWGIRYGLGGNGKAYNISGNIGLQLELKTGKKVLIGTQRPDQIKETVVQLVKEKKLDKAVING